MKKVFLSLILIMCTIMCVACGKDPSITYSRTSLQINIGTNYVISSSDIKISNSKSNYEIISLDEDIAVVEGLVIIPKSLGETTLRFQLVDNNSIRFDVKLSVVKIIYAEDISITNDIVYVNLHTTNEVYNPIIFNEDCNEIPEVTFDSDIISYDYLTGKVTAKKLGETEVVVLFRDCNVSFRVYVIDKIFTKSLIVEDCTIIEGYEGKFAYSVFPNNANTYGFFTNSEILEVTTDGCYKALESGTAIVYCEYTTNAGVAPTLISFNVNVIEQIDDFEISIVDTDEQEVSYYLIEKKYRLKIDIDNSISTDCITILGNINLTSEINSDNNGLYVDFYFEDSGEVEIKVSICFDGSNVALESIESYNVNQITDIEIMAKNGIYIQSSDDGKFYINLSSDDGSVSLLFTPILNDLTINEELKVYDITSGSEVEITNLFEPSEAGTYTLVFKILDVTIIEYQIIVF